MKDIKQKLSASGSGNVRSDSTPGLQLNIFLSVKHLQYQSSSNKGPKCRNAIFQMINNQFDYVPCSAVNV